MEVVYFARPDGVPNRLVAYRRQHRLRHAETYDSSRGGAVDDVVLPLFFRPATVLLLTALPVGPGRANMMLFSSAGTQPATAVGWSGECLSANVYGGYAGLGGAGAAGVALSYEGGPVGADSGCTGECSIVFRMFGNAR